MTHDQLISKAVTWLRIRCGVVISEMVSLNKTGEIPDAIGFTDGGTKSFLIECKTSRSDFLADQKKPFRKHVFLGMGDFRFYMAPTGLIKVEELPTGWGLIELKDLRSKPIVKHNPFGKGNIYDHWYRNEKIQQSEINLLYSALRRTAKTIPSGNK